MSYKLFGFKDCDTTKGCMAVAHMFNVDVQLNELTPEKAAEMKAQSPMGVFPVLTTECGKNIFGMHAICTYAYFILSCFCLLLDWGILCNRIASVAFR